jgi:transcriptional regulator with XRE-family HTH domain
VSRLLGWVIRNRRLELGLTQRTVGERVMVSRAVQARTERGLHLLGWDQLRLYAVALRMDPWEFLDCCDAAGPASGVLVSGHGESDRGHQP